MMQDMSRWKAIQNSMAIEGYEISDAMLEKVAREHDVAGGDAEIERLVAKAKAEGRSLLDLLKEHYEGGEGV